MSHTMVMFVHRSKARTLGIYILFCIIYLLCIAFEETSYAQGRYGEIVLKFQEPRKFYTRFEPSSNTLTLEFKNVSNAELEPLNLYDPAIIHRTIIKDNGPEGHLVHLVLKDSNLLPKVEARENPYRVSIQVYEKGYTLEKDQATQLPLASAGPPEQPNSLTNTQQVKTPEATNIPRKESEISQSSIFSRETKRKLLQPLPEEFTSFKDWRTAFDKVKPGRGSAWKEYPLYIYAFPLSAYESRAPIAKGKRVSLEKFPNDPVEQAREIASISFKSYVFGDEFKALHGYQQILYKDPSIFEKDVLHLWALAEIHLGQNNLSLAQGYYKFVIEKFPESSFRQLAELRLMDIRALRLIPAENLDGSLEEILKDLKKLQANENKELLAQISIREAYWQNSKWVTGSSTELPLISKSGLQKLKLTIPNLESKFTHFLASSLIIRESVEESEPWTKESANFAKEYFQRNSGLGFAFVENLKKDLGTKFSETITKQGSKGELAEIMSLNPNIPEFIRPYMNRPSVDWYLGESYRNHSQWQQATAYYQRASDGPGSALEKAKSLFWLLEIQNRYTGKKGRGLSADLDQKLLQQWSGLNPEDQRNFENAYKSELEKSLDNPTPSKTFAKIILNVWEELLATKTASETTKDPKSANKPPTTPSANGVRLISKLENSFERLGLGEEKRKATQLYEKFDPKDFSDDKESQRIWSDKLANNAEAYRKQNNFLRSGEIYVLLGERTLENEKRSEFLYKGSLLLYRAGKREEAIKELTKASQDNNNLFYASLAKERLNKLQK